MAGQPSLILFDGVCNLCNGFVNFVIDRDPGRRFVFASLQSSRGAEASRAAGLRPEDLETLLLVEPDGRIHRRSAAALRIARGLRAPWPLFFAFIAVPPFLRDAVYKWVAGNRYRWFGKRAACRVPGPNERGRFVE